MTLYFWNSNAVYGDDEPAPTPPNFAWFHFTTGDKGLISQTGSVISTSPGIDAFWIDSGSESVRIDIDGLLYADRDAVRSFGHFATVSVNGHVIGGSTGVEMENRGTLHVGASGTVEGDTFGAELTDSTLYNDGTVTGNEGVRLNSGIIHNNGTISSNGIAIDYFGAESIFTNTIDNAGLIQGEIETFTADVTALVINNSGVIDGAISLGNGADQIINSGTITGRRPGFSLIDLGDGNNIIDSRGGYIYGDIRTGDGDDTIQLGDEDNLVNAGAGHDVIDGGGGSNTIQYDTVLTGGVRVNLTNGTAKSGDAGGDTLSHFQNVIGTALRDVLTGDGGDNTLDGIFGHDVLNGGGGNDTLKSFGGPGRVTVNGGDGNDTIVMVGTELGAAIVAASRIDGGSGYDTLTINRVGALTLSQQTLVNVENIQFIDGFNESLTTNNATVVAGKVLEVDASALTAGHTFTFNGSAETNSAFDIDGGLGNDTITGGAGADSIAGHWGSDTQTGGAGGDTFAYTYVNDSLFQGRDHVTDFVAGTDEFLLASEVTGMEFDMNNANVSNATQLKNLLAGHFFAQHAILVRVTSGGLAGETLLVIDTDGHNGYSKDFDMVINVTGITGALTVDDFVV